VVQQRIAEFLLQRKSDRPLFLYVNFHDAHYPYHHREMQPLVSHDVLPEEQINPGRAAELRSMYDNSAANVDRAIGETLNLVAQRLGRKPAVVVTADHGESLFDEGFLGHGYALNDAQTRIPLIAAGLPLRIDEPFGQVDLRHALGEAMSEPEGTLAPLVASRPGKAVFQYLGNLDRPRQIAFATGSTRRIFDFRTHRYQEDGGDWIRPEDLRGASSEQYLELVRYWERVTRATGTTATSRDQE
jgi:arylsulfatase A-like enzyme